MWFVATSFNTVFVAHFVRLNWFTPTSQIPKTLCARMENENAKNIEYRKWKQ